MLRLSSEAAARRLYAQKLPARAESQRRAGHLIGALIKPRPSARKPVQCSWPCQPRPGAHASQSAIRTGSERRTNEPPASGDRAPRSPSTRRWQQCTKNRSCATAEAHRAVGVSWVLSLTTRTDRAANCYEVSSQRTAGTLTDRAPLFSCSVRRARRAAPSAESRSHVRAPRAMLGCAGTSRADGMRRLVAALMSCAAQQHWRMRVSDASWLGARAASAAASLTRTVVASSLRGSIVHDDR